MSFMDLFLPMMTAFIAASIIVEFFHFLLGMWLSKRQAERTKEYYKEMAEKMGMEPEAFMAQLEEQMGGMAMPEGGLPSMMGNPMGNVMTTTSGTEQEHGQYL
jgi:hypothetical protein